MTTIEPEKTYDMSHSDQVIKGPYLPLQFSKAPPPEKTVRDIAQWLISHYHGKQLSREHCRMIKTFNLKWRAIENVDGEKREVEKASAPLTFTRLCDHLRTNRALDVKGLILPPLNSNWLDSSVAGALNFHAPCNQDDSHLTFVLPPTFAGPSFPVAPKIDREGVAISAVQLVLQKTTIESRNALVAHSSLMFDTSGATWLQLLMSYLNSIVSTIEATIECDLLPRSI